MKEKKLLDQTQRQYNTRVLAVRIYKMYITNKLAEVAT